MEAISKQIKFSARHEELAKATEKALSKIKPFLIQEAREKGTPIVVADKEGKPLHITPDQFEKGDY
jgi:hypothetical protein